MVLLREQLLDNRSLVFEIAPSWFCSSLHVQACVLGSCVFNHMWCRGWRKNLSVIHQCFQGGWFLENNMNNKKILIFFFLHQFLFHVWFGNYCCSAWQCQYIYYLFSFTIFPVGVLSQHYNHLWMLEMMMIIRFPFLCLFVHCTHFEVISWTFLLFSHRHCFIGKSLVKKPN